MRRALCLLPNALTGLRALLAPPLYRLLLDGQVEPALLLLAAAIVSDLLDGWLARRLNVCTRAGAFSDALADFAVIGAGYGALVAREVYPVWLLLVLAGMLAQFVITTRQGRPVYDPLGRYYGAALYGALVLLLVAPDDLLAAALLAGIVALSGAVLGSRRTVLLSGG